MKIKKLLLAAFFLSMSIGIFGGNPREEDQIRMKRVDLPCKMDCTNRGYGWGYCDRLCSY